MFNIPLFTGFQHHPRWLAGFLNHQQYLPRVWMSRAKKSQSTVDCLYVPPLSSGTCSSNWTFSVHKKKNTHRKKKGWMEENAPLPSRCHCPYHPCMVYIYVDINMDLYDFVDVYDQDIRTWYGLHCQPKHPRNLQQDPRFTDPCCKSEYLIARSQTYLARGPLGFGPIQKLMDLLNGFFCKDGIDFCRGL